MGVLLKHFSQSPQKNYTYVCFYDQYFMILCDNYAHSGSFENLLEERSRLQVLMLTISSQALKPYEPNSIETLGVLFHSSVYQFFVCVDGMLWQFRKGTIRFVYLKLCQA